MCRLNINIFLLIVSLIMVRSENEHLQRQKRSFFLFPMGGLFKLVIGVAIPVKLGTKQSMVFALNLQFQYVAAQNHSQLEVYPPILARSRDKRQIENSDRGLVYLGLESLMNRYGIDGKSCLLRSICENAMESLHFEANGLYGHLIHITLTPNYGDGEVDLNLDPVYYEAQKAGEYGVDCLSLYPSCSYGHGILDLVSLLDV